MFSKANLPGEEEAGTAPDPSRPPFCASAAARVPAVAVAVEAGMTRAALTVLGNAGACFEREQRENAPYQVHDSSFGWLRWKRVASHTWHAGARALQLFAIISRAIAVEAA